MAFARTASPVAARRLDCQRARPPVRATASRRRPHGSLGRRRRCRSDRISTGRAPRCPRRRRRIPAAPRERFRDRLASAGEGLWGRSGRLLDRHGRGAIADPLDHERLQPAARGRHPGPVAVGRIPVSLGPGSAGHESVRRSRDKPAIHPGDRVWAETPRGFDRVCLGSHVRHRRDICRGQPGRRCGSSE